MPQTPHYQEPSDAKERRAQKPIICYDVDCVPAYEKDFYENARANMVKVDEVTVPPRDGKTFHVPKGHFFRINSVEGPQVGDLNLFNAHNMQERFFSGKTRQLHATHVSTGDRLWSNLPYLRPLATITHDTLDWYGWDEDGGGVHDVIGTRCDPYTNHMLKGVDYNHCCHSNLTRAVVEGTDMTVDQAEPIVHDVLNVFMCTGFTKDTHQYFMKASPVRPGDFLEMFAEIDLVGALSTCPGGDCGSSHSDDSTACYPLHVEIFKPADGALEGWQESQASGYGGKHGL
ncbi:urea carboxylase-associated family protein [Curvivirga aplysinae]|uniref:urea carboxylase-associated family protein n=1 Tax=Curvivirga aplysinae TaxID=2529852 RepID=UPI0012BBF126|nr:DUF1989 domain-containing protein [Curvivirga aplysinae]MTI10998.1 DUF1989 domain-containing protein [Curvivirga aplysinae]